jgi:ribonuclease HIII
MVHTLPARTDCDKLKCTWKLEEQALRAGWRLVAGCDEVGRGALLGPLYAAAVLPNKSLKKPLPFRLSPFRRLRLMP